MLSFATPRDGQRHLDTVSCGGLLADSAPRLPCLQALQKATVVAAFFGLWYCAYDAVNALGCDPVRTIHLTRPSSVFPWIIQPWTAVVYVAGAAVFPFVPFLYYRSWRGIAFVLSSITVISLISFMTYWAWPVSMARPEFAGGTVGERLMRWVHAVDKPANCFPSLHVVFAVLGALLISRAGAGRWSRWFWWSFAAAVSVSAVTTGQHYFIDVPGGVVVALAGYSAGNRLVPAACPLSRPVRSA
jgi:membrane-associated phospholipid phosphatase